jgi:hypothetical protein
MTNGSTLTNTGTLQTDPGGSPTINGIVTNAGGTISIGTNTSYGGCACVSTNSLDNAGALTLADGAQLTMGFGSVTNDVGGSISNSGDATAGSFVLTEDDTFTQGAGTISPSTPNPASPAVIVQSSTLTYTGTGKGTIELQGNSLSGNLAAGQNLVLLCTGFTSVTAGSSFTNAGTITFAPANGCGFISLNVSGTLNNSGTLASVAGGEPGGIEVSGTLINRGTVSIAKGDELRVNGTFPNYSGATDTLTGGRYLLSGTFEVDDSTLPPTGIVTDAANIVLSGGSFIDSNGNNALRNLASIASKSLFELIANENFSTVGSLSNAGAVGIGTGSTLTVNGNYSQTSTATWGEGVTTTSAFGRMNVTGTSTLAGKLEIVAPQSFTGTQGAVMTPLTSSSNTGTFATVTGAGPYKSGDSLAVGYTATGFTLTVQG